MKRAIVRIQLLTTEEGGRRFPLLSPHFRCPVFFEDIPELSVPGHAYDCNLFVAELNRQILPGDTVEEIAMAFLAPDLVFPHLKPGARFRLWEGKTIGTGLVLRIEEKV